MYPDADTFNPRRWLDPSYPTYREPLTQYPNLNGHSQFGFGRRTCQGIPIVEQDLFLTMGGMAWAFNICKRRDPVTGEEEPVHWNDYTPLLIAKPVRFPFDALARSREKVALMREMFESARDQPGSDLNMDIDQFKADLGDQIYTKEAADRGQDPFHGTGEYSRSNSSSDDDDDTACDSDSAPETDTPLSTVSTLQGLDEAEADREPEKFRVMWQVPLDPRLKERPEPAMPIPGMWSWA